MRKHIAVALALALCLALAATAQANLRAKYQATYVKVDKANAGPYAGGVAGRNLADDGVLTKRGPRRARPAELRAAISTMENMLAPPAPAPVVTSTTYSVPSTTTTTTSGGCPSYMAGEASSPSAVNPSSGAAGCFQILPSTQAAYGCSDVGVDCAARICADVGNSAWVASGSTPCDYISQP